MNPKEMTHDDLVWALEFERMRNRKLAEINARLRERVKEKQEFTANG